MTEQHDLPRIEPRHVERFHALVDILYLIQVVWLYIVAAIYPFFGLFYGILLMTGSISQKGKQVGKVCLILGIVNVGLFIIAAAGFLVLTLTGVLAGIASD